MRARQLLAAFRSVHGHHLPSLRLSPSGRCHGRGQQCISSSNNKPHEPSDPHPAPVVPRLLRRSRAHDSPLMSPRVATPKLAPADRRILHAGSSRLVEAPISEALPSSAWMTDVRRRCRFRQAGDSVTASPNRLHYASTCDASCRMLKIAFYTKGGMKCATRRSPTKLMA